MKQRKDKIDFSSVLAAAVHDMKNSLSLMIQSIEELESTLREHGVGIKEAASIHYQAARLNTGLIQLLSLYRTQLDNLPLNIDEHYLDDFIDDVVAYNQNHINTRGIDLTIEQEEDLHWYFDQDLVNVLISDVIVNAIRYGKHKLIISAREVNNMLELIIEDDGPGYPDKMLDITKAEISQLDISTGRTGLGLFFARLIAEAHVSDDKKGAIELANGGRLGGGVFALRLP
ncbi:sensor histidine kinase [Planctobacterium marinum]|uniref:Sensor histidine kinase n=2 Tax=Planctobacterium marinum TaxID=1631968 RepID=A0AA48HMZ0_9ALTE|nr:sensor histidine kinase [Planctobacterium marinum]